MVHRGAPVHRAQQHPGQERAKDGLQPEARGQGQERHQHEDRAADPDLRGGVRELHQLGGDSHGPAQAGQRASRHQHEH